METQININPRIAKAAEKWGLEILNYEGFSRGGWNSDRGYRPSGMWVFGLRPKGSDIEADGVTAENIKHAIEEIEKSGEYHSS